MKNKFFTIPMIILIILFLALCFINAVAPVREFSENENRYLAKFPEFSFERLFDGSFMKDFDTYVGDQFTGRDFFVSSKAEMEKLSLKKENNGIYIGKNGYLIPEFKCDNSILEKNIEAVKKLSETEKLRLSLCIVPTAYEVKKDELPQFVYDSSEKNVIDRIYTTLENEKLNLIQPLGMLLSHKDEYIYYKTDHHQTAEGGYLMYRYFSDALGYDALDKDEFNIKKLTDNFYGTSWSKVMLRSCEPDEMYIFESDADISVDEGVLYDYSKLDGKDKYAFFLGGNYGTVRIQSSVKNGRKLAIIKDSYANNIVPFLVNNFETIYLFDLRYFNEDIFKTLYEQNIMDVLILYGSSTFSTDSSLSKVTALTRTSEYIDITGGLVGKSGAVNDYYFNDAVFIGDSLTDGLRLYSGAEGTFLSNTGVSVTGIMYATDKNGNSIAKQIAESDAGKFYIMLGLNDGVFSENNIRHIVENYGYFIDTIKKSHPKSIIYIQSMLPVSEEKEKSGRLKNELIYSCNEALLKLASEKGVYFLKVYEPLVDEEGCLKKEITTDGIHLKTAYYKDWYDYLKTHTVPVKNNGKVSHDSKSEMFAGGGVYDVNRLCDSLREKVGFKDELTAVNTGGIEFLYNLEVSSVINGQVMLGGGSTAEEIAVFEYEKHMRSAVETKINERIESKRKSYDGYMPQEMPKLKEPVTVITDNLAVLCICDNNKEAEKIINEFLKNR